MAIEGAAHRGLPAGDDVHLVEVDRPPPLLAYGGNDPTVLLEQPSQVFCRDRDESFVFDWSVLDDTRARTPPLMLWRKRVRP